MKLYVKLLIFQVTINAFVTVNGNDGAHEGGDGGVISTKKPSERAVANPGKRCGHGNDQGQHGAVLGSGDTPSVIKKPCHSKTEQTTIKTVMTSSITSINKTSINTTSIYTTPLNSASISATLNVTNHQSSAKTQVYSSGPPSSSTSTEGSGTSTIAVKPTPSSSHYPMQSSSVIKEHKRISKEIIPFVDLKVNSSSAMKVSWKLVEAVESIRTLTAEDSGVVMDIIEQIVDKSIYVPKDLNEGRNITMNVIRSCTETAKKRHDAWGQQNSSVGLVPRMTDTIEDLGESISMLLKNNETFIVQDDTITLEVTNVDVNAPKDRDFPTSSDVNNKFDIVKIPREVFATRKGNVNVIVVQMNISNKFNLSFSEDGSIVEALSSILAVRLSTGRLNALAKPVIIRQKLSREVLENDVVRGGFWKSKRKTTQGSWSYSGCTSKRKGEYVETKSTHMTSFAVLLSFKKQKIPDHHAAALGLITYIGCGISLFGLLLTFATFVTLDTLDPERTAIHTNLVIALGIAQIVFLAGINATKNKAACTAVAVLLHYFFTAAFAWMFAEGIHLYKKVVSVFSHGSKLKFYYVIGWGLPVIIIALSTGIRPDGYGNETACWISLKGGLIWAFVAPVIIVMIINLIVMFVVVKILMSSVSTVQVDSKTSQETNRSTQQIKAGVKAMIILMPILGLSWIFGLLAVNDATIVFQYLFCIFNSLQGLFMFLIHCVGNSEVRAAFRRLHEKHTLSRSIGEKSVAKSVSKKPKTSSPGAEILVRRDTPSSQGSTFDGRRTVTPKVLSAGQISLNSLNSPVYDDSFDRNDYQ